MPPGKSSGLFRLFVARVRCACETGGILLSFLANFRRHIAAGTVNPARNDRRTRLCRRIRTCTLALEGERRGLVAAPRRRRVRSTNGIGVGRSPVRAAFDAPVKSGRPGIHLKPSVGRSVEAGGNGASNLTKRPNNTASAIRSSWMEPDQAEWVRNAVYLSMCVIFADPRHNSQSRNDVADRESILLA